MRERKTCLDCDNTLLGRKDKKFCSDHCRSNYYNQKNREDYATYRKINSILKKNRTILLKLNPKGNNKVLKEELIEHGFKFSFFTHYKISSKGKTYYFCYDQGLHHLNGEMYQLYHKKKVEKKI